MQWRVDGGDDPGRRPGDRRHRRHPHARDARGRRWPATRPPGAADTVTSTRRRRSTPRPPRPPAGIDAVRRGPVAGADGAGSGVDAVEVKVDGGAVRRRRAISGDGVHTLESRHRRQRRPRVRLARPTRSRSTARRPDRRRSPAPPAPAGTRGAVSCTRRRRRPVRPVGADARGRRRRRAFAVVSGDAPCRSAPTAATAHARAPSTAPATDDRPPPRVKVDRTLPTATLTCARPRRADRLRLPRQRLPTRLSGLASLSYSLDGGAWTAVAGRRDVLGRQGHDPRPRARRRRQPVPHEPGHARRAQGAAAHAAAGHGDAAQLERAGLPRRPQGRRQHGRRAARRAQLQRHACRSTCGRWPSAAAPTRSSSRCKSGKHKRTVTKTYKVGKRRHAPAHRRLARRRDRQGAPSR